jgi:hypothetical protein
MPVRSGDPIAPPSIPSNPLRIQFDAANGWRTYLRAPSMGNLALESAVENWFLHGHGNAELFNVSIFAAGDCGFDAFSRGTLQVEDRTLHASAFNARLIGYRFQNSCDGMRNARLKREDAFSHAMIIVSSAMVSSS